MSLAEGFCKILQTYINHGLITNTKPNINMKTLHTFLCTLLEIMNQSNECFIIMAIYFDRLISRHNFIINSANLTRLLFMAGVIALKIHDDFPHKNSYYAKLSGLSQLDLNQLEKNFLVMIDYKLMITYENYIKFYNQINNFV